MGLNFGTNSNTHDMKVLFGEYDNQLNDANEIRTSIKKNSTIN